MCLMPYSGSILISASNDFSVKFWKNNERKCIHSIDNAHNAWIWSILYSSRQKMLITASYDQTVKIWQVTETIEEKNKKQVHTLKTKLLFTINNHISTFSTSALTFVDGTMESMVLVGDQAGIISVINVKTGAIEETVTTSIQLVQALAVL